MNIKIILLLSVFFIVMLIFAGFSCQKAEHTDKESLDTDTLTTHKSTNEENKSAIKNPQEFFPNKDEKLDRSKIRIEVLNGCGVKGIAKDVTNYMRSLGYDVVGVGNAKSFYYDVTIVVDRVGYLNYAKDVAKALGTDNYIQQIDKTRLLEVSLIIGKDYKKIFEDLQEEQKDEN